MAIDKPKSPFKPEYEKPLQEFIDRLLPHIHCDMYGGTCAKEPDNCRPVPLRMFLHACRNNCRTDIHNDFVYFNGIKISHQDIANAGVKVDDLDNYHMLVRDLVEEKPKHRRIPEKSETPWYSRMAPMDATFGVKSFNKGDKQ